jgi:hypothetical protein
MLQPRLSTTLTDLLNWSKFRPNPLIFQPYDCASRNEGLSAIPSSFIDDLSRFFTHEEDVEVNGLLPQTSYKASLCRTVTAPPGTLHSGPRQFVRVRSAANPSFGVPRNKLTLYLSNNRIEKLPLSFFNLGERLGVLSLRKSKQYRGCIMSSA